MGAARGGNQSAFFGGMLLDAPNQLREEIEERHAREIAQEVARMQEKIDLENVAR